MSRFTDKNNIDLMASRMYGRQSNPADRRYMYHLWEDVVLTDLVPYQLGNAFSVNNCVAISIQPSILVNPCIVSVRDGSIFTPSYPIAVGAPKGFEVTNGEVLAFESDGDPEDGYIYLNPKNYWIQSLISGALTGCAVHICYGVLP